MMQTTTSVRCEAHNWIDCTFCPRRRQAATVDVLVAELLAALDRGELDLVHQLDDAIGRALVSPEAAETEQNQFDQRDPH